MLLEKVKDAGAEAYKHFRDALGDNYNHIVVKLDATPMDAGNVRRGKDIECNHYNPRCHYCDIIENPCVSAKAAFRLCTL